VSRRPCENFLYGFKGAQSAPRGAGRCVRRSAARGRHLSGRGACTVRTQLRHLRGPWSAPGRRLAALRPYRATAAATADQTPSRRRTDTTLLGQCRARAVASAAIPPGALILKPCEFAVKGAPAGRVLRMAQAPPLSVALDRDSGG